MALTLPSEGGRTNTFLACRGSISGGGEGGGECGIRTRTKPALAGRGSECGGGGGAEGTRSVEEGRVQHGKRGVEDERGRHCAGGRAGTTRAMGTRTGA
jgi:hypothetical protein